MAGILAVGAVAITAPSRGNLLSSLETQNVVRLLLIGIFFILLFFGGHSVYKLFRITNCVLVPITVGLLLLYIWIDALGADELSREDRVIEDFSFLFPMVGTACLGIVGLLLLKRRELLVGSVSILGSAVFFVIGMEEISWFQRVLDVESSEFFRNLNSQGEMNFHNVYTHESEDVYYFGGFLLLGVLPFFRESLARLLSRINLSAAIVLLPPAWLIVPFLLAGAFVSQGFAARAANASIVLGSIILLIAMIHRHYVAQQWGSVAQAGVTLGIMIFAIILLQSLDFISQEVRPWIGKEYQEFYIAWGIAAYGVSVLVQYFHQFPRNQIHPQAG